MQSMYNNYKGIKTPLIFLSTHLNSSHPFDYRNVTAAAMEEHIPLPMFIMSKRNF